MYIEDKQFAKAVECLSYVPNNSYNDRAARSQLLSLYEKMQSAGYAKASKLAAEERSWIAEYDKQHPQPAQTMQGQPMPRPTR
jgi:hypothetical protein